MSATILPRLNTPLPDALTPEPSGSVPKLSSGTDTPDIGFGQRCYPEKPTGVVGSNAYALGGLIEKCSDDSVQSISGGWDRIGDAASITEKVYLASRVALSVGTKALSKAGSVVNVVTGIGDAAVAYKKSVDMCGDSPFEVGYSVVQSAAKIGSGTLVALGATMAVAAGLPVAATIVAGAALCYGLGKGIEYIWDVAKPSVKSIYEGELAR